MVFHSYGNVPNGEAILYKFPLSAFTGSTPPSVSDAAWTYSDATHVSVKAAHFLPDGRVAALITGETLQSLVVLNGATSAVEWGPIDYHAAHGEGTDMKVSADGTMLVIAGQGEHHVHGQGSLAGRLTAVDAATGTRLWTTTFDSGGTPTLIYNECWGVAPTVDNAFVVGCGTGIEDCLGIRNTDDCAAGRGDLRPGAYLRGATVWQSLVVKIDASGTLLWQRVDSFKEADGAALGSSDWAVRLVATPRPRAHEHEPRI